MQVTHAPRRHLASSELVDCSSRCPVCGSEASRRPVFRLQSAPDVAMLACTACGACSASHMPTADVLERYYADYYAVWGREVTFSNAARFAKHLVNGIPRDAFGPSTRILDYGGGDGSLSREVGERLIAAGATKSVDITVVDFLPRDAQRSHGVAIRFQPPAEPLDHYDLVLASAILEHVPDLHQLLGRLDAATAPGGIFYARTPWAIPLTKLMPRLDLAWPAHVHDLGSPFWNRFPETFSWSGRMVASRPSLVAGSLREDPFRTLAAVAMKLPGRVTRFWPFVGGWEVLMQRTAVNPNPANT